MSEERNKGHEVYSFLANLIEEVGAIDTSLLGHAIDLDPDHKQLLYLQWCLEKSDEPLIDLGLLDALNAKLMTVQSGIRTLSIATAEADSPQRQKNIQNSLNSLRSSLGKCLGDLSYPRVQQVFRSEAFKAIDETVAHSKSSILEMERSFANEREDLEKKIVALNSLLDTERVNLETQQTKIADLVRKNAEFEAKQTNNAQSKATAFDALIEERRELLDGWKGELESEGEDYLEKIKSFYRLSGDNTLSGRFLLAGRAEQRAYITLTIVSIFFFCGAIWSLIFGTGTFERFFNLVVNGPMAALLLRLSLVAVFIIPAGVFSQLAAKHRRASVWYQTLGVRVATLKPYLEEFGSEQKDEYKEELKEILKAFFVSELKVDTDKHPSAIQLGLIDRVLSRITGA